MKWAVLRANLPADLTPHCARHGGASADAYLRTRSLTEIQHRGRWEALTSVARYKRPGSYIREMAVLSREQRSLALRASRELPALLSQTA